MKKWKKVLLLSVGMLGFAALSGFEPRFGVSIVLLAQVGCSAFGIALAFVALDPKGRL